MLNLYSRRAFILLAIIALEPVSPVRAQTQKQDTRPTLWDVLSRTETPNNVVQGGGSATDPNAAMIRHGLGPIPGFTIAGKDPRVKVRHTGFFGHAADWLSDMQEKTGSKVKATGNSTLSVQQQSISGNSAAFQSDQYLGRGGGGFYNDTDVSIDATMFKWFHYTTRISNSLMKNPNDNRVKLDYKTAKTRVEYGDINVSFQGNSLIDFSRYLHGLQVTDVWSPSFKTVALYSQTKAATQTIVINGNNSSGPYYVYAGQIVDGSAEVRVDNQVLTSGTDYTLDTFNGQLNFTKNRIVLQSDTIAVSFETLGAAGSQGFIYGGKAEVTPNKRWGFGVTWVTQTSQGTVGNQTLTEQYYGYGTPTFYTTNQPIDLTKPLIITVAGLILSPSQYKISSQTTTTNQILIYISVPSTEIVQIQYSPIIATVVPGDRSVVGVDAHYLLGKLGSFNVETALSGLSVSNQNINGHAYLLRAKLNPFKNLHTTLTYKSVNPTFSSIQSPGFTQNERSAELSADYAATNRLKFNLDVERASRPTYTGSSEFTVSPAGNDSFTQYTVGTIYTLSKTASISLTRNDVSTVYALGGKSVTGNDALTYSQTIKSVGIDLSFNDNTSNVSSSNALLGITTGSASALTVSDSSSYGTRFGIRWQANKVLNLNGAVSVNKITTDSAGSNTGSTAKDAQVSATYSGFKKVRLSYSLDLSDTGSAALSSTSTGTVVTPVSTTTTPGSILGGGINSGLGGFGNTNNVVNNSTGYTSFGGSSLTNRIQAQITPHKNMQLGINLSMASSLGDYQYNSNQTSLGFNYSWQYSEKLQFTANYNLQHLVYTGNFGGTDSHTAMLSLQGKPFGGRLGFNLGIQTMQTSSAFASSATSSTTTTTTGSNSSSLTNTSNDLTSVAMRLDYPLNKRETLFVEYLDSITAGYLANTENDIKFGMDYNITKTLKFSLGWQIDKHNYSDPSESSLNYSSSNLLAQFGAHF